MRVKHSKSEPAFSEGLKNLQDRFFYSIMDVRQSIDSSPPKAENGKKLERSLSISQGHGRGMIRYFTFGSLFLLACLTVTLLILPLVLPPLPPPPFLLLVVPIGILILLIILAFMPSDGGDNRIYV